MVPREKDAYLKAFKQIVGSIVLAFTPISQDTLLKVDPSTSQDQTHATLMRLRSMLYVPEDSSKPITTLHTSFTDFLMGPADHQCPPEFRISPDDVYALDHLFLNYCYGTMSSNLHQDMVDAAHPDCLVSEITNRTPGIDHHITSHRMCSTHAATGATTSSAWTNTNTWISRCYKPHMISCRFSFYTGSKLLLGWARHGPQSERSLNSRNWPRPDLVPLREITQRNRRFYHRAAALATRLGKIRSPTIRTIIELQKLAEARFSATERDHPAQQTPSPSPTTAYSPVTAAAHARHFSRCEKLPFGQRSNHKGCAIASVLLCSHLQSTN